MNTKDYADHSLAFTEDSAGSSVATSEKDLRESCLLEKCSEVNSKTSSKPSVKTREELKCPRFRNCFNMLQLCLFTKIHNVVQ